MKLAILIVIVNLSGFSTKLLKPNRNDKVIELITDAGYEGEAHRVETEDGYLLKVHRLLPKTKDKQSERKPVFLMHGILATAADFLVTGPEIALAYLLADSGYDGRQILNNLYLEFNNSFKFFYIISLAGQCSRKPVFDEASKFLSRLKRVLEVQLARDWIL